MLLYKLFVTTFTRRRVNKLKKLNYNARMGISRVNGYTTKSQISFNNLTL